MTVFIIGTYDFHYIKSDLNQDIPITFRYELTTATLECSYIRTNIYDILHVYPSNGRHIITYMDVVIMQHMLLFYGESRAELLQTVAYVTDSLENYFTPWAAYQALMTVRLIELDKKTGVRPSEVLGKHLGADFPSTSCWSLGPIPSRPALWIISMGEVGSQYQGMYFWIS